MRGGRCGEPTSSLALRRGSLPPCQSKRTGNSTARARGHKRANTRGTYRTAWAVAPRCRCSYAYGRRVAVGPQTGARSWEFLCDLWRAVAPLFAPWCAEGEMSTCANLNHYGGAGSCVRWHRDDEALFGEQGESKLIVSVSIGYSALFRWKPRSSPECEADSCWPHHGDLLVMDGRCEDEYLHSTDPRRDGERVNITYRRLKNHLPQYPIGSGVMCCLPACVRGSPVSECAGIQGSGWGLDNFLWFLLRIGIGLLTFLALVGLWRQQRKVFDLGFFFPLWNPCFCWCYARENSVTHAGLLCSGVTLGFWALGLHRVLRGFQGACGKNRRVPYTLAKIGLPSPFSDDTCKVLKPCRALGRVPRANER